MSLVSRIKNQYLSQVVLIGLAVILGIAITYLVMREILVKEALAKEADYFWGQLAINPDAPLAATKNLRVYFLPRDKAQAPHNSEYLKPGYHDYHQLDQFNVALLSENNRGQKLLVLFNRSGVDALALSFGILPLLITLIVLYTSVYFSYRYTKKMLSPAKKLADNIRNTDLLHIDKSVFSENLDDYDEDTSTISLAISDLVERIESFVERERNFTRDASHELRSPNTVIKMASELLSLSALNREQLALVENIASASNNMAELTEFFLMLAREESAGKAEQPVSLSDVVDEEIRKLQSLSSKKSVPLLKEIESPCLVPVQTKVLSVLLGNLIRNALLYTDEGYVKVSIQANRVAVMDTGTGIDESKLDHILKPFARGDTQRQGYGVGLNIVQRLCHRFCWRFDLSSKKSEGTTVAIAFS